MRSQDMTDRFKQQIELWAYNEEEQNAESEKYGTKKKATTGDPQYDRKQKTNSAQSCTTLFDQADAAGRKTGCSQYASELSNKHQPI